MNKISINHYNRLKNKIRRQRFGIDRLQIRRSRKFLKFKTLLSKIPWPTLCEEIIGIQPIAGPTGTVFHLNLPK